MIFLQWSKMQFVCLLVLGYIGVIYIREGKVVNKMKDQKCNRIFDFLFIVSEIAVLADGITATTVNYRDVIPPEINYYAHLMMYLAYEVEMFLLLRYWFSVTVRRKHVIITHLCYVPFIAAVILTIKFMPSIYFVDGVYSDYSMGIPVYICFAEVGIYCALSVILVVLRRKSIPQNQLRALFYNIVCVIVVLTLEITFHEFLGSAIAITLITVGIYISMEDPYKKAANIYHNEMIMGFATLVDNKDDNTGGHIRRSSAYAVLIAENLRFNKKYTNIIGRDFLDNIKKAAPMHDIGKIGIPDSILQKPGKLTDEEFAKMKLHPVIGDKIIRETFGHLGDDVYGKMTHEIVRHHHEKWNGKGYPDGLMGIEIPLPARIMAVADVFDAVSAKRCYRDALPLDECFNIIKNGNGIDFDPDVVEAFFMDIDRVKQICMTSLQVRI